MIKLNNKNITYVALADSNNSLKAPKEIWYADSNSSVKLVYRRKDALIEGVDYEKYHWLVEGVSGAYIDTLINPSFGDELNATFTFSSKPTISNISLLVANDNANIVGFITGGDFPRSGYPQLLIKTTNDYIEWGSRSMGTTIKDEYYMYMKINNAQMPDTLVKVDGVICNKDSTAGDNRISEVPTTTYKVGKGYKEQTGLDTVKLRNVTISSNINLIPCKLLKPVPKWLDANGIRRQVGECGMIDLVSGKFYGNVNSVGTFTVENYYERKEWLIADIPIDTSMMTLPVNSDTLYFRRIWKSFGNSYYFITNRYNYYTYFEQKKVSIYDSAGRAVLGHFGSEINVDEVIDVDSNSERMIMHNVEVPKYGFPITSIRLNNGSNGVDSVTHYTSVISVDSKERYIPCTLTMDLPASMDANNIARTKGTSGMWDLVSDRFYGNVANSGTFKAVNLAEGVDYEVHDWLVGEISSKGMLQILPINSSRMSYRVKRINGLNLQFFMTEGNYIYFYWTSNNRVSIWDLNQSTTVYSNSSIIVDEFDFECSAENVSVNGVDIPIYGFPITEVKFHAADSGGMKISTSSIIVDGIERYIPVKLLRSIPAKYDANGIARQVGECGMYDTVNDVFYGNVASSGTFTVADD